MWSFIHVADIHVGTPRSFRFQPAWNENWQTARKQVMELEPDLLLVGGDMTRDGSTHRFELEQVRDDLNSLPFPTYIIPGNHEIGNKYLAGAPMSIQPAFLDLYASVYGSSEWTFVHKNVRFSGFNAFLLGSGLPGEDRLRTWLEDQTRIERAAHHVWMMHPALFADTVDEADWDPEDDRRAWYFALDSEPRRFVLDILKRTGATNLITAHIHCRRTVAVNGIKVHFAPSTAFPQWKHRWLDGDPSLGFLRFNVDESGIEEQFVPLAEISEAKGYGPGGNPAFDERDYSLATEQPALSFASTANRSERQ